MICFTFSGRPSCLCCLRAWASLMWGRVWLSGQAHHRVPRSLRLLKWASALVLVPMFFYGLLVLYVVMAPKSDQSDHHDREACRTCMMRRCHPHAHGSPGLPAEGAPAAVADVSGDRESTRTDDKARKGDFV